MKPSMAYVSLLVKEYVEAISFFTSKLNFEFIQDHYQVEQDKRWVLVAPSTSPGTAIVLAKASNEEQKKFIGNQTGGRVFLFLNTDDFWRDYHDFISKDIEFVRPPKTETYGTVAVFKDLYGNLWDWLQLHH